MKYKLLSRSALKWIALITMFIDHIGAILGSDFFQNNGIYWLYLTMRTIGRLSFPIFAFFVAQGWLFTKNKKRYVLLILLFAVLSQPIYYFALNQNIFDFNILFTFLLSIVIFYFIDKIREDKTMTPLYCALVFSILIVVIMLSLMKMPISYGVYGVILPVVFYIFSNRETNFKCYVWLIAFVLIFAYWLSMFLFLDKAQFSSYVDIFALLSLPLLLLYNGKKGKGAPKYLFYVFYPSHILVIYLITLFI